MDDDLFDDGLARSNPATVTRRPDLDVALRAMVRDAEDTARPVRPRRRATVGVAAATALALVIGGGGVAVASGLVSWPGGFEDPDGAYSFSLPSGRACEVRLIIGDPATIDDPTAEVDRSTDTETQRALQDEVAQWLRGGALDRALNLPAAEAEVRAIYDEQAVVGMTVIIGADGWLEDAASVPGRPDADDIHAFAVDRAVGEAMTAHLKERGFPENSWTFSSEGGVKCAGA
ncbi:hypothetical protein [Microbacterium sp. MYb62]|uniref:hypothetical protein n=1 Tax=Microbacterium sp. MYb62 TaxID=1848690 RepID=UPI000CFBE6FB|nr:hypothetical protein [Microbacterium sp. MYb62]PRB18970.1 hypothetical protein CQ042_00735 [Microbacterium sp. MYb62]